MKSVARALFLAVSFVLGFGLSGCGDGGKPAAPGQQAPAPSMQDADFVQTFQRGVMELEQHRFSEAAATFDALTKARPTVVAPWINLAAAQLNRNVEEAHPLCIAATDRATALDAKAPQPHFLRGILFKHLGRFDDAEKNFRKALELSADDPAALYHLASIVAERDVPEAIRLLEKALEGETHLSSAYYALMGLKRRTDRDAVGPLLQLFQAFEAANTGNKMNIVYTEMGRLGEAVRDLPIVAAAESRPTADDARATFGDPVVIPGVAVGTVDLGGNLALVCDEMQGSARKLAFHAGCGADGLRRLPIEVPVGDGESVSPIDVDQDGNDDLAVLGAAGLRMFRSDGTTFKEVPGNPLGGPTGPFRGHAWSDLDQDADLDLLVWSEKSITIFLNKRDGTFERHGAPATESKKGFQPPPLPNAPSAIVQVNATDLDSDGDPDILIAGDQGFALWRNDRLMRFTDVTERAGLSGAGVVGEFRVADLDGDRAFDIVANVDATLTFFRQVAKGSFRLGFTKQTSPMKIDAAPIGIGDLDADGIDELVMTQRVKDQAEAPSRRLVFQSVDSFGRSTPRSIEAPFAGTRVVLADLNCDFALDLIVSGTDPAAPEGTRVFPGKLPPGRHALTIRLAGKTFANTMRANTGGIGARIEVMAGGRSQVREVRSRDGAGASATRTQHFGLGTRTHADYVRIVWPDDVLQSEGWVPGGQKKVIEEFQRKASSCPILFAWNGERFECVTDFLGTGGLGFFLEPGVFGAPDPTEQVLIPNLKPKDGKLELRIHEPLEEITYLDLARLIVVDHPEGVDVVPDERFAINAPQPDGKLFAIGARIDPIAARDGRKNDVLAEVLRSDRKQARAVADPRFIGYAERTTFDFDFGAALVRLGGTDRVVLALDGWVEYPYSHVNLAAFQAGVRLEALSVDVEVAGRGFVRVQNEACYPAGMPRVMTLPLGRLPEGLTGKLRLSTNQELWIDRLFLFEPADVTITARTIDATRAELRPSGFPREYSPDGQAPRLYDYDIRDPSFPWKTMSGAYTAFGDVAPLLGAADDCYVVFGGGEEVALTFDAPPPPAPGMKRTYVLDTFGWCKDMDPYTAFPLTVEPLPFRGMSNYPYAASESFPDGEAQRRWRARYQTRHVPGVQVR